MEPERCVIMATNKKAPRFIAVALLSVLGLTACSEIVAKPSDYDNHIVTDSSGTIDSVEGNLMNIVYDAMREGTLASDVLDEVLYEYSVSVLGRYNKLVGPKSSSSSLSTGSTLKEAVASAESADHAVANAFIASHKAYWTVNSNGERVDDEGNVRTDSAVASDSEIETLIAKWETIEDRIAEKMYDEITQGAYSYRSQFSEKTYLTSLRSSLEKVANYNSLSGNDDKAVAGYFNPKVFDSKYDYKDVFDEYLHRENYQTNYLLGEDESTNTINYVEDSFIPEIYRELLTEQYLFDETYNTLGRSYARKVNIISLATKDDSDRSAQYLMNYFVNNVIYAEPKGEGDVDVTSITDSDGNAVSVNRVGEEQFIALSDAYKGVYEDLSDLAKTYLAESNAFDVVLNADSSVNYYKGTDFGDLMEKYAKIKDNPLTTDTSIESDFTNSGAYTKEVGLEIKTRALATNGYTTKGWYIKNGGLTDFSTFRDRLFNIGVASALDNIKPKTGETADYDKYDRFYLDSGDWKIDTTRDYNTYVARINGSYYLKNTTSESSSSKNDIVFYDSSSKTYYVVQIEEAVSSSKFNKSADAWNYAKLRNDRSVLAEYVNEVAKILASNDSYKTLAKKHWLEEMGISYHDDVVYDYFKSNYPELFD